MTDILDLDALVPPTKKLTLKGVSYDVYPLTIRQLVELAKMDYKLSEMDSEEKVMPYVINTFKGFIPNLPDDADFTVFQMRAIITFAQNVSMPEQTTGAKEYAPKKKVSSPEESPTSSDSTRDTQSSESSTSTPAATT